MERRTACLFILFYKKALGTSYLPAVFPAVSLPSLDTFLVGVPLMSGMYHSSQPVVLAASPDTGQQRVEVGHLKCVDTFGFISSGTSSADLDSLNLRTNREL